MTKMVKPYNTRTPAQWVMAFKTLLEDSKLIITIKSPRLQDAHMHE